VNWQKNFLCIYSKIFIFFVAKKGRTTNFSPLLFCRCCWIRDPGIRNTAYYGNPKEHCYLPNKSRILGVSSLAGSGAAAAEAANGLLALAVLRNFSIAAA
jgi:hypothetical protein